MKNLSLAGVMMFLVCAIACHDDFRVSHIGCCDNPAIYDSIGNSQLYLPNIFTPNGDGINDALFIRADSIRRIINFEIRDKFNNTVFQEKSIDLLSSIGWDGKVDGKIEKGIYTVLFTLEAMDGTIGSLEGKVCNFPCGIDGNDEKISEKGCHFDSELNCWMYDDGCQNLDPSGCFE